MSGSAPKKVDQFTYFRVVVGLHLYLKVHIAILSISLQIHYCM